MINSTTLNDRLQNRNEGIDSGHLYACERCDNSRRNDQEHDDTSRYHPVLPGCRHRRDHQWEILLLFLNRAFGCDVR